MRILQIAPLWEPVPPVAYGGTEAVVHLLTEGLVRRGHKVVLYASGDSATAAELRSVYPRSLRTAEELPSQDQKHTYDLLHAATALGDAREFDIVHNHAGELPIVMSLTADFPPMLTTLHCLITPSNRPIWEHYHGWYNVISRSARRMVPPLPHARSAGVVYNAIDVASFPFRAEKDDYLLHLSRIAPEKGTHLAIEAAKRTGARLVVAGKVDRVDVEYFETVVRPLIDGKQVEFVGEVTREEGKQLYAGARALLLPLQWEEPFGLVMPEALACGTPVIAFRRGSAPEIIRDGETGFLVEDVAGMVAAIERLDEIDPSQCRADVAARFDTAVMVEAYEAAYRRMLEQDELDVVGAADGALGLDGQHMATPKVFGKPELVA